jgi:hypothetical protein
MPSPFPGMNPYLEQQPLWRDFHQRFVARAADHLVPQVGEGLFVGVELNIYLTCTWADRVRWLTSRPRPLRPPPCRRAACPPPFR